MTTDTITGKAIAKVIRPMERFNKDILFNRLTAAGYNVKAATCASRINQLFNKSMITRHKDYGHFYATKTQLNALAKLEVKKRAKKTFGMDSICDIEKLCLYGKW